MANIEKLSIVLAPKLASLVRGADCKSRSDPGTAEHTKDHRRDMAVVRRAARAEDDLVDLGLYVAADNPDAADRLLEEIYRKCMLLAGSPLLGRARPDIAPKFRNLQVGNDLILYRALSDGVEVVRVVHGARRLDGLL